jgi:DNA mismatch repair protein MutS
LNEIQDVQQIKTLKNVGVYHMSVTYHENSNALIYDRKLKQGSCSSLYGLEVCKSLDMPPDFLLSCNIIRQQQLDMHETIVSTKTSRYSSDIYVDICSICKTNKAVETHHIKEQKLADKNNFIGHLHKNHVSNLLPLCEECHYNIHEKNNEKVNEKVTKQKRKYIKK